MPRTVGHTRPERRSRQGRLLRARRSPREYRPEARRADPRCASGWSRGAARPDRTRHARAFRWPHVIVAERLRPHVFRLPIEKIRAGYKSDIYFARTKLILERDKRHDRVTMQVFQKHPDAVVVGTDQTLAILHVGSGHYRDRTRADALFDRYLSAERRLYTAWTLLPAIDWSAYEPGEWWGWTGLGTVPHALIAAYGGDTTVATLKFDEYINRAPDAVGHLTAKGTPEGHVNVTSLVDFNNDVVNTSLGVAHALGARLWGVRVDTSESLVDRAILRELEETEGVANSELRGVTPRLVELLREALDRNGYRHVRIVASGGFDAEKIRRFEELRVPVDVYGVGSALVHGGWFDHTADIVRVEGRLLAKTGRRYIATAPLHQVDWRSLVSEKDWAHSSS